MAVNVFNRRKRERKGIGKKKEDVTQGPVYLFFQSLFSVVQALSHAQLFVAPWTVAHQALCPWDFPGKNPGVGCRVPTQGLELGLLHWQADS